MSRRMIMGAAILVALALIAGVILNWPGPSTPGTDPNTETAATADFSQIPDSPYWTADDQWVEVAGLRTRVRQTGAPDAAPIILIHGFSVSLESWDAWAEDLSTDYRVIRADLPGHGLTGPDPQKRYSVPQTAAFIGDLMTAMDIDQAIVGGNSLGGLAAWRFAADNPDRISALILVSPGGYSINGVTEDPVAVPAPIDAYLRMAPPAFVSAATAQLYGDASRLDPAVPTRIAALMAHDSNGAAMVERLEVFTLPDPESDLARVTAPTLILHGERDAMIPVDHSRDMAQIIPNAHLVTFDDLGHVAHEEAPGRTLAEVRAFLQQGDSE